MDSQPSSSGDGKELAKNLIRRWHEIQTKGCGRVLCTNPYCASNPDAVPPADSIAAALKAVELSQQDTEDPSSVSPCTPAPPYLTLDSLRSLIEECQQLDNYSALIDAINKVFGNVEALNQSFLLPGREGIANKDHHGVNLEDVRQAFALINNQPSEGARNALGYALESLGGSYRFAHKCFKTAADMRLFMSLLELPGLWDPDSPRPTFLYGNLLFHVPHGLKYFISKWWSKWDTEKFKQFLKNMQQFLTMRVLTQRSIHGDENVRAVVRIMAVLYESSIHFGDSDTDIINYKDFYNDVINQKLMKPKHLTADVDNYFDGEFTFRSYPFILTPAMKSQFLRIDSRIKQQARARAFAFHGLNRPYFILPVNRQHLVTSTINYLWEVLDEGLEDELKKELKVKFEGEEGIDEGGVKKEFFQLIIKELFDPKWGMFLYNEEVSNYWFCSGNDYDLREYELVGIILGLAIYNGVILDVRFPFVLYKRLMGSKAFIEDIEDVNPAIYKGLRDILAYAGNDMESAFGLNFQATTEHFGERRTVDLVENGANILVNQQNKEEYVMKYTEWLLETSVEQQFAAFLKGFQHVCNGFFFELFRAEEIELLICGEPTLNFEDLQKVTQYENGYSEADPTIINFWSVLHSLDMEHKKKFLAFATGSDRAPIGGLKAMRFQITRHGEDGDRLPQAHTCFNVLLLPPYSSKDKLRERLMTAISNSQGFGMI